MTRDEIIKGLEKEIRRIHSEPKGKMLGIFMTVDEAEDIVALLKEQEAVEARKKNDGKPQPWTSWWYVCGECGGEIDYRDRFCRYCGKAVKWDECADC